MARCSFNLKYLGAFAATQVGFRWLLSNRRDANQIALHTRSMDNVVPFWADVLPHGNLPQSQGDVTMELLRRDDRQEIYCGKGKTSGVDCVIKNLYQNRYLKEIAVQWERYLSHDYNSKPNSIPFLIHGVWLTKNHKPSEIDLKAFNDLKQSMEVLNMNKSSVAALPMAK